jgi:heme exporter protein C
MSGVLKAFWEMGPVRGVRAFVTHPLVQRAFVLGTLGLFISGAWLGLAWAPPDREMGHVQRIMYVHVPLMEMALLAGSINFICCVLYLFKASWKTDALAEATAEVGLVFGGIGMVLGSIWGRPTWGVYWAWDPRLTTMAILLVAYAGYLALRRFVDDPDRRAVWSAVAGIVIAADIPIVYFSVRWWKSLHQIQSSPKTVDKLMVLPLRWNLCAFLGLLIIFLVVRYRIALAARLRETTVPDAPQGIRRAVAG